MTVLKAIVRAGRIETETPLNLPEGTELLVTPVRAPTDAEEGWDNSPEAVAAWLAWYESLEPLVFTEEEKAALESDRQARKEREKANFDEYADKLTRMWE